MTENTDAAEETEQSAAEQDLRIVGIAASAGGLEAVSLLAQKLPPEANAVYVIAQHMSPTHKSVLSSLISRETTLPVFDLEPVTTPQPNAIYVTPPNTDVIYNNGVLRLRDPSGHPASPKPSADRLFKSLAENCGEKCLGIVLSGTGSDGSYGVQAIREAGGITIAQDPDSAKYDGMPASAIATGCIDLTLTPGEIGTHLEKILAHPRNLAVLRSDSDQPSPLTELFGILRARTRIDFTDYKENTLNRRIARRMTALAIDDYEAYIDYCRTSEGEVDALHRDLLISVTRFFRDPDQFDKLRQELHMTGLAKKSSPIRVWIIGCATGEEAYTVAIILTELLGGLEALSGRDVQVFATDIDQAAIEVARRGVYPITAAQDIPKRYLNDYFILGESDLTVRPELRAITLFSHHNVCQDPPFINVDLVSIRNVLIYFNLALQERVLSRIHYALGANGLLFLGKSESVGEMSVFFDLRQGGDKLFSKRRGISGEVSVQTGDPGYRSELAGFRGHRSRKSQPEPFPATDSALARVVAPNGLICTRNGTIIEVLGDITPFLEIRAGSVTSLNLKMLMEPLSSEAMSLMSIAIRNEARRDGRWHEVSTQHGNRVQLQAFPFSGQSGGELQCLLAINTAFEDKPVVVPSDFQSEDQRAYVERMEQEIKATQEALQQTIEELQTANEELQSSNEELQSTNEEFQATNEELETSNEELQSTNEELLTVNEELQISSAEKLALASELEATMTSAPYVVALADQALMLRRTSQLALDMFGLTDVPPTGIHLSQCSLPTGFPALAPIASNVLRLQEARRVPVLSEGKYYAMVMSPVHDRQQKLIGLSITITLYDSEPLSRVLEMVNTTAKIAHWSYNLDTKEIFWSEHMFEIFGREISGQLPNWEEFIALIHPEDREDVMQGMEGLIKDGTEFTSDYRVFGQLGHIVWIEASVTVVRDSFGNAVQLVGIVWDKHQATESAITIAHLETVQEDLGIGFFSFDVQNNAPIWNQSAFDLLGYNAITHKPSVESLLAHICVEDRSMAQQAFQLALERGEPFEFEATVNMASGQRQTCYFKGRTQRARNGRISHVFGSIRQGHSE